MQSLTPCSNQEILAELDALAASKAFRRSPGLMGLLRFVVEAELRGEGSDLKETLLGISVYHRPADYDPKADGIVRVNANRLRARLNDHYRHFHPRVQITMEPGSYRPIFVVAPPDPQPEPSQAAPEVIAPPTVVHRSPWRSAVAAALLVLCAGMFVLLRYRGQDHWTQHSVSSMSGVQQYPAFSPDSRMLAYAVEDPSNGLSALYIQDIQSNTPIKLTSKERYESRPVWSPDGRRLAFVVRDHDHTVHVLVRPAHQDLETEIYTRPAAGPQLCDVPRLSWSPRGDEIITTAPPTVADMAANPHQSHGCGIVAVNVATHAVRHITYSPTGTDGDLEPAISPDGQTIAFLRYITYDAQVLYLVAIDGGNERRVSSLRDKINGLAWMPDGKGLLICARQGAAQLYILRLDHQSGQTFSLQAGAAPVGFAAISPDGRHIAYTEYHQQNKLFRLKDGHLQYLFDDGLLRQYQAFSPDGARIAYSSDRTGQDQLWVSDHEGRGEFLVISNAGMNMMRPVWSADGNSLVFECRQGGPSAICAVNLHSHRIVRLVRMQHDAILPFVSRDGKRLYFTSNDTGNYAGYRQMIHTNANGDLVPDGKPEQMTIGGTVIIYESPSGRQLYLVGGFPSLSLLAVPVSKLPVSLLPGEKMNPNYVLRQKSFIGGSSTVTDAGLLSVEKEAVGYHLMLYREDKKEPEEMPHSQIDEPIDSIAWDPIEKAVLLSTSSSSIGFLLILSK